MESFALKGLYAPATISVDNWGMPHIQARNVHDAFFVQGFNAVRDRLWKIDLRALSSAQGANGTRNNNDQTDQNHYGCNPGFFIGKQIVSRSQPK